MFYHLFFAVLSAASASLSLSFSCWWKLLLLISWNNRGTIRVQLRYNRGTIGVQWGYNRPEIMFQKVSFYLKCYIGVISVSSVWEHLEFKSKWTKEIWSLSTRQQLAKVFHKKQIFRFFNQFTSSLSCSFLLIFLYRWNSPDPAPAELRIARILFLKGKNIWHKQVRERLACVIIKYGFHLPMILWLNSGALLMSLNWLLIPCLSETVFLFTYFSFLW